MRIGFFLICALFTLYIRAAVHPVSISWLSADLRDERVVVKVKINAEDLLYFHDIHHHSVQEIPVGTLKSYAKAHETIILKAFMLADQAGPLQPQITSTNFQSLESTTTIHVMDLLKYPLYYTLEFPLNETSTLISFTQNLIGVPAVSFLSVYKNGNTLVENIELSKSKPFIMSRDALSIGSSREEAFMVSYFTLSDTRLTHELTLPWQLLRSFVAVDSVAQLALMEKFIGESSVIVVDGLEISPVVSSVTLLNDKQDLSERSLINIQISYPLNDIPKNVSLTWDNFNWRMRWFESVIDAFGEEQKHKFSRFQPQIDVERKLDLTEENKE
ncbi:MAG: hypothetical protein ACJA08_001081 [Cyclobacteriaceae bacterium]|jgi:hypothetical protein